jgi:hypothetical protein
MKKTTKKISIIQKETKKVSKKSNRKFEYLKNDICGFKILNPKPVEYYMKKKNIISVCFFKKEQYSKNFNIYMFGLKNWVKFINSFKHNYIIRIFIDNNVYEDQEIMKIINSCSYMEPILFECADYIDNKYHIDLFGTMVRFFPMFDFKNNDANKVIISDIDLKVPDLPRMRELINQSYNSNVFTGFSGLGEFGKTTSKPLPHLYANGLYSPEIYKKKIIIDFIKNIHTLKNVGYYGKRFTDWGFGVDEIFINEFLVHKMPRFNFIFQYTSLYILKHYKYEIIANPESLKIMKQILGKYYNNKISLVENIEKNRNEILNIPSINEKFIEISKRFYSTIKELHDNNNKWLPDIFMDLLLNKFKNIIKCVCLIEFDNTQQSIQKIHLYKKTMIH